MTWHLVETISLIEAEVDRAISIDEADENNNVASKVVAVGAPIDNSVSSEDEEGYSYASKELFTSLLVGLYSP